MNAIQFLSAQPWVERLGLTLLHFLWQGAVIAGIYAIARLAARSSHSRYLLGCAALSLMAIVPLITWIALAPAEATVAPAAGLTQVHGAPVTQWLVFIDDPARGPSFFPWVVATWLAGAAALWIRLLGGWMVTERLRFHNARPAPPEWQQRFNALRERVRLTQPVRLLVSTMVHAPTVVGCLRPVVLVPLGALAGLPPDQLEALLLHELAHIRRQDYLINLLQSVVEALLFYHPAVWWISAHVRTEREHCCDDAAVALTGDALVYARALADLESARQVHLRTAMAASGGNLADRIARLLGYSRPSTARLSSPAALLLVLVIAFVSFAQPAPHPKFEAASVKPSTDPGFQRVQPMPGRLVADAGLKLLIQNAYTLQPFQIEGAPEVRYRIEATAGSVVSHQQLFLMLQSLLEERFQLKYHRETRDLPVYALVAARGGLKLPPPKEGNCVVPPPDAPNEWAGGRMQPPQPGQQPPLPRCGSVSLALMYDRVHMQGGQVPMQELTRVLSMVLGRIVIDRTGYSKPFDVRLDFQADQTTSALPPPPPGTPESDQPSIVPALQDQLGLRLESTKGPVEVMVIDHVERPSAN